MIYIYDIYFMIFFNSLNLKGGSSTNLVAVQHTLKAGTAADSQQVVNDLFYAA